MAIIRWDPGREVDSLQSDVNRLFDTFFQGRSGTRSSAGTQRWIPAMDLTEKDNEFVLRADLPGMSEDDVAIEVKDNVLTISGERKSEHEEKGEGFYRVERSFGSFSRSLDLPTGIDAKAVSAEFDKGVLEVRIPKPEQAQATKVQISGKKQDVIDV